MKDELFPSIKKSITDLINDEEGNIPRTKLVIMGSTIMLMGMVMGLDVFSAHRSHSSHSSHSSTSYHRSHTSHSSHRSHSSSSHGSHSSHSSHSNSSHSSGGSSRGGTGSSGSSHKNSVPKPSQIPVPQKPVSDSFTGAIPNVSAVPATSINSGTTQKLDA